MLTAFHLAGRRAAWNWAILMILMILMGGLIAVATDAITKWRKHFARKKQA